MSVYITNLHKKVAPYTAKEWPYSSSDTFMLDIAEYPAHTTNTGPLMNFLLKCNIYNFHYASCLITNTATCYYLY